tara:strand:+ start:425 stop:529 length:105 start_codon:yes stop_codon:yes gene_type:complete
MAKKNLGKYKVTTTHKQGKKKHTHRKGTKKHSHK